MENTHLRTVQNMIDWITRTTCIGIRWLTLIMVLMTFLIVVLRYGFNLGWIAMQESVIYLHAAVLLLGSAHTLRIGEHVRVDIFYRQQSEKRKALVDFVGTLVLLLPVNFFILIYSWSYVSSSWRVLEGSPEAGGLAAVFLLKSLIIVFAVVMLLQGFAELIRHGFTLTNKESK